MRFVNAGGRAACVVDDQVYFLSEMSRGQIADDPTTVLRQQWKEAVEYSRHYGECDGVGIESVDLGPPIPAPRSIFGLVEIGLLKS